MDNNVLIYQSGRARGGPQLQSYLAEGKQRRTSLWIKHFNGRYRDMGRDPESGRDALMTTTKKSIEHWREIIDLYVELGIRNIHLRPLNPFGFANKTWRAIGYTQAEYLDFYEQCLDYILELNARFKLRGHCLHLPEEDARPTTPTSWTFGLRVRDRPDGVQLRRQRLPFR